MLIKLNCRLSLYRLLGLIKLLQEALRLFLQVRKEKLSVIIIIIIIIIVSKIKGHLTSRNKKKSKNRKAR